MENLVSLEDSKKAAMSYMSFHDALPREWRDLCNEFSEAVNFHLNGMPAAAVREILVENHRIQQEEMLMGVA